MMRWISDTAKKYRMLPCSLLRPLFLRPLILRSQQQVRWHQHHEPAHASEEFKQALAEAPQKFKSEARKRLQSFAKLPWEVAMSPEDAAKTLGAFVGIPNLEAAA